MCWSGSGGIAYSDYYEFIMVLFLLLLFLLLLLLLFDILLFCYWPAFMIIYLFSVLFIKSVVVIIE